MIYIGTSGYNYPEWRGTFYPEKCPSTKMFAYYAERFNTVEINYTFYRTPTVKTTTAWREQAPAGFRYVLKAPQRITHYQRLKGAGETLAFFCESARVLGEYLGPLLFQLPPNFRCDVPLLDTFLSAIPGGFRPAFEFRHDSWLVPDVFACLRAHGAALCVADFGDKTTPIEATARHGYFRLRDEGYTPKDIDAWAARVIERMSEWDDVFVFFKHEDEGRGPEFAAAFRAALASRGVAAS
jgi:uncharacterized protein YecE (DUF72 family)